VLAGDLFLEAASHGTAKRLDELGIGPFRHRSKFIRLLTGAVFLGLAWPVGIPRAALRL
jgi:hypothetical protein